MATKPCITIIGTGLIGTSLGMAIGRAKDKDVLVIGHDKDFARAKLAQKMGGVDKVDRNLISACAQADLIVLAIPASGIRQTLEIVADDLKSGCTVTDVASVKVPVIEWADELLPAEVSFVGGDPILFGDEAGIDAARPDLFQGKLYCIIPSTRATAESVKVVTDLAVLAGAAPHFIDPHEHDGLIGGTEHIADVLAAVLLHALSSSGGWRDMRRMCGATFDRVTCFSSADPAEYRDRAQLNRENLLRWIDAYQLELDNMRRLIAAGDGAEIEAYYEAQMETRLQWLKDRAEQNWGERSQGPKLPTPGEYMSQMLLGGLGGRQKR
jgi:prephenate dehydrogenase